MTNTYNESLAQLYKNFNDESGTFCTQAPVPTRTPSELSQNEFAQTYSARENDDAVLRYARYPLGIQATRENHALNQELLRQLGARFNK